MKKIFLFLFIVTAVVACDKDSFETKPTLKLESVSNEFIPKTQSTTITFSYTDKEGDIDNTDSSLVVTRFRTNVKRPRAGSPLKYKIPTITPYDRGEIVLALSNSDLLTGIIGGDPIVIPGSGGKFEPDTIALGFMIRDKAGNKSDTVRLTVIAER